MREKQRREEIALLAFADRVDLSIVRGTLVAVVVTTIVVVAIPVVLAIGIIVFLVIGNEVIQREAVMGGDEVDARPRAASAKIVDVARTKEARGEILRAVVGVEPVFPRRVAIFVVHSAQPGGKPPTW